MKKWIIVFSILASMSWFSSSSAAEEPGWSGRVIVTGQARAQIQATPVVYRPYRPLHFYGNTVRRRYYRSAKPSRSAATVQAATDVVE
jgi:hypothetical protein